MTKGGNVICRDINAVSNGNGTGSGGSSSSNNATP